MAGTALTTEFSPRFPGEVAVLHDFRTVTIAQDLGVCALMRVGRFSKTRPFVIADSQKQWAYLLKDEVHDWLVKQNWSYELYKNTRKEKLILMLHDEQKLLMFKLAWQGMV